MCREDYFHGQMLPPLQINDDELDRSVPSPPFAWRDQKLVKVDISNLDYDPHKLNAAEWDKISQTLKVVDGK